jgi:protease I
MRNSLSVAVVAMVAIVLFNSLCLGEARDMNVVMIIAPSNFRDEELFETKKVLEGEGVDVSIASSSLAEARGMLGGTAKPDILVTDIQVPDYDAVVFVGGSGAEKYWNSAVAHRIAREAVSKNKVVAAICIAPVTLANAGVLQGKRATVWPTEGGKLEGKGAIYTKSNVEVDGTIVTGSGPHAAEEFGSAIAALLKGR